MSYKDIRSKGRALHRAMQNKGSPLKDKPPKGVPSTVTLLQRLKLRLNKYKNV